MQQTTSKLKARPKKAFTAHWQRRRIVIAITVVMSLAAGLMTLVHSGALGSALGQKIAKDTKDTQVSIASFDQNSPSKEYIYAGGKLVATEEQPVASCTFSLSSISQNFSASGGSGSVIVSPTPTTCSWSAASHDYWITITSGSSGTGSGTVIYSVSPNNLAARTGTMTIAGITFTVTQDAPGCTFSLSPNNAPFGSGGGTGYFSVSTGSTCSWTATPSFGWISITSGGSGTGNGTVYYSVASNTNTSPRTGTISVADQVFTVTQDAAGGSSGPVAYWRFDEGSGLTAADSSGNGNTGTLTNGPTWISGRINTGLSFDGADDYVQVGVRPSLAMTNAMTMSSWVNPSSTGIIVNKEGEYEFAVWPDGHIYWAFANTYPGWAWIDTGYAVPFNQWTHVAVVYSSGTVKTYLSGLLVNTYQGSGAIAAGTNEFRIGGRQCCAQYFGGRLDEIRMYNRALSDSEVQTLANEGGGSQTPFNGPHNIPCKIEAEDFDYGGEGIAYHDLSPLNDWGQYRPAEAVDIVGTGDAGGGYEIGNARQGEWLEYTVYVTASQNYDFQARVASEGPGGTFHYEIDTVSKGSQTVPNTGSWGTYQTITLSAVPLTIGQHVLRLSLDTNGTQQYPAVANFNWINIVASGTGSPPPAPTGLTATAGNAQVFLSWNASSGATSYNVKRWNGSSYATIASVSNTSYTNTGLINGTTYYYVVSASNTAGEGPNSGQAWATPSGSSQTPFNVNGTPWAIPGLIEAENFDNGGETIAYHDNDTNNIGGAYRSEGVDISACAEGGYEVGWAYAGEWLEYTVNVTASGTYNIQARVASDGPGGTFHLEFDGVNKTGTMTVPNTGGWATFTTVTKSNVSLTAGSSIVLRIAMDTNGSQVSGIPAVANFNYINIVAGGTPPSPPTGLSATAGNALVTLTWNPVTGATGYNVKRSGTSGGPYSTIATNVTTASYVNTGLTNGTTYYYVVSAVNAAGESGDSTQVSATPTSGVSVPPPPTGLSATASNAQVTLNWNASSGATSYNVKRSGTSGGPYSTIASNVPTTSYVNTGLTNGTTYYYVVSAVNSAGESADSGQVSATPSGGGTCTTTSLLSGSGAFGYLEGLGASARWRSPVSGAVAKDPVSGLYSLFVADTDNCRIRMIYLEGPNTGVSILIAGAGIAGYWEGGGDPLQAYYNYPNGVSATTDANGVATELLIADSDNNMIRKLLKPLSGSAWRPVWFSGNTTAGFGDGTAATSYYFSPRTAISAADGFTYVADAFNAKIRKLDTSGNSSTFATGFTTPVGITVSRTSGLFYVADQGSHQIWRVTTGGTATVIAGSGSAGFADGTGTAAKFYKPANLAWASTSGGEVLYIGDFKNHRIRKLAIATNAVTTFAGSGASGYVEGSCLSAQFSQPKGVAVGPGGEVYIMDTLNNRIRKTQ